MNTHATNEEYISTSMYIYIERERDTERERDIDVERERERYVHILVSGQPEPGARGHRALRGQAARDPGQGRMIYMYVYIYI